MAGKGVSDDSINKLSLQVGELTGRLGTFIDNMEVTVRELRTAIFGNGQPGILARLSDLETKQGSEDIFTRKQKIIWSAIGAIASPLVIHLIWHLFSGRAWPGQ